MVDQDELRQRKDADGVSLPDAIGAHGVDLDKATDSRRQLENAAAYLELHIEQGPVLESMNLPLGVVLGTFGVERHQVTFRGQAAHAGSTPMDKRRDALAAAGLLALEIYDIAERDGGVCTMGSVVTKPGIVTSVVETAECLLDQRNLDADKLATMLEAAKQAAARFADERDVEVDWERLWNIEPILFDDELIELADEAIKEVAGTSHRLPERTAPRCRGGLARRRPDGHGLRTEPARPLPHEARGHEGGAPRARRPGARPARRPDDRLGRQLTRGDPELLEAEVRRTRRGWGR